MTLQFCRKIQRMNRNEKFLNVYKEYQKVSARIAYRMLKDRNIAEDIAQDVFCYFYETGVELDISNEKKLHSFIVTSTINKCIDFLRKAYVQHEISTVNEEIAAMIVKNNVYDLEEILNNIEAKEAVSLAFQRYRMRNPMNYEILVKVKILGISPGKVAAEYGISRNNVNNRISRCKDWIEEELARQKEE